MNARKQYLKDIRDQEPGPPVVFPKLPQRFFCARCLHHNIRLQHVAHQAPLSVAGPLAPLVQLGQILTCRHGLTARLRPPAPLGVLRCQLFQGRDGLIEQCTLRPELQDDFLNVHKTPIRR